MGKSFRLWLLVANLIFVKRVLGQDNLDARRWTNLGDFIITNCVLVSFFCLLNDKKRVDLMNVSKAVTNDQGDCDGLLYTQVKSLQCYGSTTLKPTHHEGYQFANRWVLCDSNVRVHVLWFVFRGLGRRSFVLSSGWRRFQLSCGTRLCCYLLLWLVCRFF